MGIGIKRGECVGSGDSTAFREAIAKQITEAGVETKATDSDTTFVNNLTAAGQLIFNNATKAVTVSQSFDSGMVTATASNGATSTLTIPYNEDGVTFTLTPTGNNSVSKDLDEGYYKAGTVTADGSTAYNTGFNNVTVTNTVSGRTVSTTLSNGKTATSNVALGTDSGTITATLTPSGNNTATKSYAAGYYNAGTVTANGATAYAAGSNSVTVSTSVSGRTVTAKTSTGKTASSSVALGTNSGTITATLTPSGNNTATKSYAAGYYNAGTVTANGATAYAAGQTAGKKALSGTVSCTGSYSATKEDGQKAYLKVYVTATATISNGVLTVSFSSNGSATAWTWKNDDWHGGKVASGSGSKSANTTLA